MACWVTFIDMLLSVYVCFIECAQRSSGWFHIQGCWKSKKQTVLYGFQQKRRKQAYRNRSQASDPPELQEEKLELL